MPVNKEVSPPHLSEALLMPISFMAVLREWGSPRRAGPCTNRSAALQPGLTSRRGLGAVAGCQAKPGCPWELCLCKGSSLWHAVWKALCK